MNERRKLKRGQLRFNLRVYDNKTHRLAGILGDISAEGISISCREPYDKDCLLQLRMTLPDSKKNGRNITFDARTVWCKKEEASYTTGLKMESISDDNIEIINSVLIAESTPDAVRMERHQEEYL